LISIIQEIKVEVSKPNFFQAIVAKQYDSNSRFLKATLVQNNKKIPVADTSTVTINARRNDGAEKSFKGEVNEDGTVTVPLAYWMLELNGTLECDISIFGADESKLTSTKFIVEVERASCEGGDVADSDKCDILILQGQNIVGSVNGKTGVVELSAEDVGAAPAGYGFGERAQAFFPTSESELNDILNTILQTMYNGATGIYRIYDNNANIWGGSCMFVTLSKLDDSYATADFRSYSYNTSRLFKTKNEGGWHSLEWLNPPMEVGEKYKTAEKWQGKSVYVKAVKLDLSATGSKYVYIDSGITAVVSIEGYTHTNEGGIMLMHSITNYKDGHFFINENGNLITNDITENGTAYAIVKYTK
jgi:hypothetical protein